MLWRVQQEIEADGAQALQPPFATRGLSVDYGNGPVLRNVDFEAPAASLTAIVGPNGAGKSTLIKAALGLQRVTGGQALFWNRPLRESRQRVGYVPQRGSVDWDFPVSVTDVVTMGRYGMLGWLKPVTAAHRRAAVDYLDQVGMADFADRQISRLSGGQQQRVFVARALAQEADLYFLDEPFAGVDAATEGVLVDVLRRLRDAGKSAIVVHHDLATVADYFDHLLLLNGEVVAAGPARETLTVDNLQRAYGGRLAFLEGAAGAALRR
ncbi:MAG: metal ABC transporter ATP-binding protein [Beijerinckiaceae bacterium]|nr:metal ABC transporter ATP-binding protein [Beijerinckiaceae bacterium]